EATHSAHPEPDRQYRSGPRGIVSRISCDSVFSSSHVHRDRKTGSSGIQRRSPSVTKNTSGEAEPLITSLSATPSGSGTSAVGRSGPRGTASTSAFGSVVTQSHDQWVINVISSGI